jgi:hypothetical protein
MVEGRKYKNVTIEERAAQADAKVRSRRPALDQVL